MQPCFEKVYESEKAVISSRPSKTTLSGNGAEPFTEVKMKLPKKGTGVPLEAMNLPTDED